MKKFRKSVLIPLVAVFFACEPKTAMVQDQVNLGPESPGNEWTFQIPESDSGNIQLLMTCEKFTFGTIFFNEIQASDSSENAFVYSVNMERPNYPNRAYADSTHHLKMSWTLRGAHLKVDLDSTIQTICLMENNRTMAINSITFLNHSRRNDSADLMIQILDSHSSNEILSEERTRIIAFGNSTTAFRRSITGVYAQRLPGHLLDAGIKNQVINEGIPGSHTGHLEDNDRHRIPHALDRFEEAVLGQDPDAVIICFGINDSWIDKGKESPRISEEKFRLNLLSMIGALKSRKVSVVLMTPNALGQRIESRQKEMTARYAQIVRDLANSENLALIDQWKSFKQYGDEEGQEIDDLLLDGMHPNDRWHAMLAEQLTEIITEHL